VALLLLALVACPDRIEAATVDHGLRAASADEARFVARICQARGVAHAILRPDTPITGSLQAKAREARYALLEGWADAQGLSWIATAHHADDQLETMLMRLNRGSGVAGLAGIRAQNGRIIRPLLNWRRKELTEIVEEAGITAIADPSNHDDRFDRVRMRNTLSGCQNLDPQAAAKSAAALAEAEDALLWATTQVIDTRIARQDALIIFDPAGLPAELRRRIALHCICAINAKANLRGEEVGRLAAALAEGKSATLAEVKCAGGPLWRFSAAPPRRTK
jgi:tRNA(Ile)-lysidine synthase